MPPVERAFTSKCFVFLLQFFTLLFSLFILSCIYALSFLFYPFFSFNSLLSFLLYGFYCVCVRPSMGAVLAEQQSLRTHTRSLDTHCIQLTLHTQSISTHAQETHTHTIPCWQISHHAPPRQSELHFIVLNVWQICTILNIPNYFLQVSSHSDFSASLLADPPTAQEAQREDDKLSIRPGSGEFSSCLHTVCETRLSRPHVGSRGALIWLRLCHRCTWTKLLFSSSLCSRYAVLLPKIVTLQEKGGNVCLDEAACLDVIVVKGMMNWFIRWHRKLLFKWMKYKDNWRHDCERHRKEKLEQWEWFKRKYFVKSSMSFGEQHNVFCYKIEPCPSHNFIFN